MKDDEGRVLHVRIYDAKPGKGYDIFLLPAVAIRDVFVDENREKYKYVQFLHSDIHQYRFCIGWLKLRWSFAFAEFTDDTSAEEIKRMCEEEYKEQEERYNKMKENEKYKDAALRGKYE